jgi:hypothetical protein
MIVTSPLSATALANTLIGAGATLSGTPTFQGDAAQAGTFSNAPAVLGVSSGIILSSGRVSDAAIGWTALNLPNTNMSQPGYAPLSTLLAGRQTFDAAVLQFSFIPPTSTAVFNFVFASAEYPNYLGNFIDPMALFVNGTAPGDNVAVLPTNPSVIITTSDVNTTVNSSFFGRLNAAGDPIIYGGQTKVLTAVAHLNAGQVNTITLAVTDAVDSSLDSAVFIQPAIYTSPSTVSGVPALSPLALAALGILLLLTATVLLRGLPAARPEAPRN